MATNLKRSAGAAGVILLLLAAKLWSLAVWQETTIQLSGSGGVPGDVAVLYSADESKWTTSHDCRLTAWTLKKGSDAFSPAAELSECGAREVIVFSGSRALTVAEFDPLSSTTSAPQSLEIVVNPEALKLPVHFYGTAQWFETGLTATPGPGTLLAAQLTFATQRLLDSRTGIELAPQMHLLDASQMKVAGSNCTGVASLTASEPVGALYDPAGINVYLVSSIIEGRAVGGFTCFEWHAPNIIYLALNDALPHFLAHEIGHALGLQYESGHLESMPSPPEGSARLPRTNLMIGSTPSDVLAADLTGWTAGQVYRMHVDARSFLNRWVGQGKLAAALRSTGPVRSCSNGPYALGPCIPVTYDF